MPDSTSLVIQQLSSSLWVKQNNPYATNTGILIHNHQACLIDPGLSIKDLAEIKHFISSHNAKVKIVVITHAHWDHLLGVSAFDGAQVVVQQHFSTVIHDHADDLNQQINAFRSFEDDKYHIPWTLPKPTLAFKKKVEVDVGGNTLRVISTPGHTIDHSSIYIQQERILWAGDLLSDLELPLVEDINAYQNTLSTIADFKVELLVPGHGSPAVDTANIRQRFDQDSAYLNALRMCVSIALERSSDIAQTVNDCLGICFAQPDDYPNAHRWNIESTYRALGGSCSGMLGWDNDWQILFSW